MIDNLPSSISRLKSGDFTALAVTSEERIEQLPEVPTLREEGIDMDVTAWFGLLAPEGTPDDRIEKISNSVQKAMQDDSFNEKIIAMVGIDVPDLNTPVRFGH